MGGNIPENMKKLVECEANMGKNYFIKEEDIPKSWKCEDAFRPLPAELKEKKIEEIEVEEEKKETWAQKLLGQSGRVNKELLLKNIPENEMEEFMKKGKIPIGFSDSLVWTEILEKMKKLPEEQKEKEKKFEILTKEEQKIFDKLRQLEEEKAKLE